MADEEPKHATDVFIREDSRGEQTMVIRSRNTKGELEEHEFPWNDRLSWHFWFQTHLALWHYRLSRLFRWRKSR